MVPTRSDHHCADTDRMLCSYLGGQPSDWGGDPRAFSPDVRLPTPTAHSRGLSGYGGVVSCSRRVDRARPNKRLKLAGGDRSNGNGVVSAGAHELSFNYIAPYWRGGPALNAHRVAGGVALGWRP